MPELPEVEVVKKSLEKKIKNFTIKKVIMRDGISAKNDATMPPFKRTKK